MADRLDDCVVKVIRRHADQGFYIANLSREVMVEFGPVPKVKRLDLAELVREEAHRRIRTELTREDKNGLRFYENFHDGHGPRWQRLRSMQEQQLRVTIQYRRRQVQGHLDVIVQYEAILAIMQAMGPGTTVEQAIAGGMP